MLEEDQDLQKAIMKKIERQEKFKIRKSAVQVCRPHQQLVLSMLISPFLVL